MSLEDVRHVIIWQYEVRHGQQERFEQIYGPLGDWAKLFSSDPMYYGTFLHQDTNHPRRYCTVDLWASASAFAAFKAKHAAAYAALDQLCDNRTLSEKRIGGFDRNEPTAAK
jgi:heme-degrading monooxygenase HmoA